MEYVAFWILRRIRIMCINLYNKVKQMKFTTVRVPIEVRRKAEELKILLEKKIEKEIGIRINLTLGEVLGCAIANVRKK